MSSRAELIGKLEAMRSEVRAHEDNGAESVRVLVRAVDALTFVVIGMLEAHDNTKPGADERCIDIGPFGDRCVWWTNHDGNHQYVREYR